MCSSMNGSQRVVLKPKWKPGLSDPILRPQWSGYFPGLSSWPRNSRTFPSVCCLIFRLLFTAKVEFIMRGAVSGLQSHHLKTSIKICRALPQPRARGPENRVLSLNLQTGSAPRAASSSSGDLLKKSSLNTCGNCNLIDLRWCWEFVFS